MSGRAKILGASLGIVVTATSYAGFYAGVGMGPDTVDFNQRNFVTQIGNPGYPPSFAVINKAHLSGVGVFGTLFAGYSHLYTNKLSLAGELNANVSSITNSGFNHEFVNVSFSDTFIKMHNSYGVSILPGYQFTPNTLFYGRLGWTNSKIQQKTGDVSLANFSKRINGFRSGLGIKQAITERVALRMDYSYINYCDTTTVTNDVANRVPKSSTLSPNQQLLEFGIVVNFA